MEDFFTNYQYTFSALSTIGTFSAVLLSLYFGYKALRANDTNIQAYLDTRIIMDIERNYTSKAYITISIKNIGLVPVRIPFSFFLITSIKKNEIGIQHPMDFFSRCDGIPQNEFDYIHQKKYPVQIKPKCEEVFYLITTDHFVQTTIPEFVLKQKKSCLPSILYFYLLKIKVQTEDGKYFKVKISKQLKEKIKGNLKGLRK